MTSRTEARRGSMERKASRSDAESLRSTDAMGGSGPASWAALVEAAGEVQTPEDVQRARRRARALTRRYGCDDERAARFELAVHEVCANAVLHGRGGYYGMWRAADELACEVIDAGPGISASPSSAPPQVSSAAGSGLWLIRQMCERVEIESRPGWTRVRLHLALP